MLKFLVVCSLLAIVSAQNKDLRLPVVLPPYGVAESGLKLADAKQEWGTCLLYMENLGIVVFQGKDASPNAWSAAIGPNDPKGKNTFAWSSDYVKCIHNGTKTANPTKFTAQNFSFTIDVKTEETAAKQKDRVLFKLKGNYKFTLNFETTQGYLWRLVDVKTDGFTVDSGDWLKTQLTVAKGSAKNVSVEKMEVGSFNDYNYGCSGTSAAIFPLKGEEEKKDAKVFVGVYFGNLQIQPYGYVKNRENTSVQFSHRTADCVGTFTHGSLMGIIVALVLISVLAFGFLMLNSVQGIDRFDDPKQKQLIINAKE